MSIYPHLQRTTSTVTTKDVFGLLPLKR